MIKKWDQSLVGKRVTNSHYKEDGGGWCVEILYVGRNSFFGKEMNLNPKSDWPSSENAYGFRQFDWELCEQDKEKKINRLSEKIIESGFLHNPEIMKKILSEAVLKGYASEEFVEEVVKIISSTELFPASNPSGSNPKSLEG